MYFQHAIGCNKECPKLKLWKSVNLIRGRGAKATNLSSLKIQDETIIGDENIAEAFNSFLLMWVQPLQKIYPKVKKAMLNT